MYKINKIREAKMKKYLVLAAVFALASLFVIGCTRGANDSQTGYAAYGQPAGQGGGQAQQGYVGGGCGVAGPEVVESINSQPQAAA